MKTVRLVPLRCPSCGNSLPAAENDVAFACPACGKGCELREDALHPVALEFAASCPTGGSAAVRAAVHYVPFWRQRVVVRFECDDPQFRGVTERFGEIKNIYVAAFAMRGVQAFGDPGVALTQARVEPVLAAHAEGLVLGASRSSRDARKWAPFLLLSMMDRAVDVGKVRMSLRHEGESLLAAPFFDEGTHLRDGLAGGRYPKIAFLDWGAVERAARGAAIGG